MSVHAEAHKMLASIQYLCTETDGGRGIWKRIDENRELLVCLEEHAPEVLKRFPCIRSWIGCQDAFLLSLKILLNISKNPFDGVPLPREFPRPWIWEFDSLGLAAHLAEVSCKNSLIS